MHPSFRSRAARIILGILLAPVLALTIPLPPSVLAQTAPSYTVRLKSTDFQKASVVLTVKWDAYPFGRTISQRIVADGKYDEGGAPVQYTLPPIPVGTKAGSKDVTIAAESEKPLGGYSYYMVVQGADEKLLYDNKSTPFTFELKGPSGNCVLAKPTYDAANKKVEMKFTANAKGAANLSIDGTQKASWNSPGENAGYTFSLSGVDDMKEHLAEVTLADCRRQQKFTFPTQTDIEEDLMAKAGPSLGSVDKSESTIVATVNFKDGSVLKGKGYSLFGTFTEAKGSAEATETSKEYDGANSVELQLQGASADDTSYDVGVALKSSKGVIVWNDQKTIGIDSDGSVKDTPDADDTKQKGCPMGMSRTESGFCEPPGGKYMPKFDSFGELFDAVRGLVGRLTLYLAVIFLVVAGYYWLTARGDEKQIGEAKQSLLGISIGLLIVGISSTAVTTIGKSLAGGGNLNAVAEAFWMGTLKPIVNFLSMFSLGWAVLLFVFAGLRMIGSGGKQEEITKARKTFLYGMGGLLVIGIAESAVAIFGRDGLQSEIQNIADKNDALGFELTEKLFNPILTFVVSLVGSIALAMIVKAGYDFLTAAGDDTRIKNAKTEVQYSVVGLIVIGLAEVAVKTIFHIEKRRVEVNTQGAIDLIISIINWGLSFLGAIALIMYVVAGFLFVTDAGDGGRKKKGQEILTYTTVGILVILFSYAIVNIFLTGGNAYG